MIDLAVNLFFPYPKDPRNIAPSALQSYFEYGRSVEGKLARITRKTDEESAPIVSSGWIEDDKDYTISKDSDRTPKPVVSIYGMSHANLLAQDMAKYDSTLSIRAICAPGAVPAWSFGAYSIDRERHHSDVVILSVMTNGIAFISTTSGSTANFDASYPYTYPRYLFINGILKQVSPPFLSSKGYREYLYDSDKWKEYLNWLKKYDKYYNPLLFRKTILDNSSIYRVLRRAYAYTTRRNKQSRVYSVAKGFNMNSEEVKILQAIVVEFAQIARRDKSLPIIYIVNDESTNNDLFKILEPTLSNNNILFLSTHSICPPNDPRNYLPDTHFIPSKNIELANAMKKIIHENLPCLKSH
jgi:hypothetical protein